MDDFYEEDYDEVCPKCSQSPICWQRCTALGCDDGCLDMHEYDDPLWYSPGEEEPCDECFGNGIVAWCPNCGADLTLYWSREEQQEATNG